MNELVRLAMRRVVGCLIVLSSSTAYGQADCASGAESFDEIDDHVAKAEVAAIKSHFNSDHESAARGLGRLADCLASVSQRPQVPLKARAGYKYDELLSRARLSKHLSAMGQEQRAMEQIQAALELSKVALTAPLKSSAELFRLLDGVDAKASGRWRR